LKRKKKRTSPGDEEKEKLIVKKNREPLQKKNSTGGKNLLHGPSKWPGEKSLTRAQKKGQKKKGRVKKRHAGCPQKPKKGNLLKHKQRVWRGSQRNGSVVLGGRGKTFNIEKLCEKRGPGLDLPRSCQIIVSERKLKFFKTGREKG